MGLQAHTGDPPRWRAAPACLRRRLDHHSGPAGRRGRGLVESAPAAVRGKARVRWHGFRRGHSLQWRCATQSQCPSHWQRHVDGGGAGQGHPGAPLCEWHPAQLRRFEQAGSVDLLHRFQRTGRHASARRRVRGLGSATACLDHRWRHGTDRAAHPRPAGRPPVAARSRRHPGRRCRPPDVTIRGRGSKPRHPRRCRAGPGAVRSWRRRGGCAHGV